MVCLILSCGFRTLFIFLSTHLLLCCKFSNLNSFNVQSTTYSSLTFNAINTTGVPNASIMENFAS